MRWVMGLIIAAGVLGGAWPAAKVLWDIETGAAPFTTTNADGSMQQAEIGPKSYWPNWAPQPEGARFAVKAHFGPGANQPETGYAELGGVDDAAALQAAYAARLAAAGWEVNPMHLTVALPEIPPRSARLCQVLARKDGNTLMLSVITDTQGLSRLHWTRGAMPPTQGAERGLCR